MTDRTGVPCARVRPNKSDREEAFFLLKFPLNLDTVHSKQILHQGAVG